MLKYHLFLENKIYLLNYATLQLQVRGANVFVSNKQVIALLIRSLKVHMRRAIHYYQVMCRATKGSVIIPEVTDNSRK